MQQPHEAPGRAMTAVNQLSGAISDHGENMSRRSTHGGK